VSSVFFIFKNQTIKTYIYMWDHHNFTCFCYGMFISSLVYVHDKNHIKSHKILQYIKIPLQFLQIRLIGLNTGCRDFSSSYRAGGRVETSLVHVLVGASGEGG
jgi:hypothetical protein